MLKSGIDQDALAKLFSEASAKQGEALRKAVSDATLKALQGRELTAENIRKVLKSVTQASTAGAALNTASPVDVEALLEQAFTGMDTALLQAVEAQRKALEMMVAQGVDLQEKQMKSALAGVEKLEDLFFAAVGKATAGAGNTTMQGPWQHVLDAMKLKGTATGAQANSAVEQLMAQAQTALRDTRASSLRTAQAMLDGYATLASGVLIGMSQGLTQGAAATSAKPAEPSAARKKAR